MLNAEGRRKKQMGFAKRLKRNLKRDLKSSLHKKAWRDYDRILWIRSLIGSALVLSYRIVQLIQGSWQKGVDAQLDRLDSGSEEVTMRIF